jgi:hypothetical protein
MCGKGGPRRRFANRGLKAAAARLDAAITKLTVAYHAVLHQLGLVDREDGATLMVAKRIIDLATLGERDPERLTAATMEALGK